VFQTITNVLWYYLWLNASVFLWLFPVIRTRHWREHRWQRWLRQRCVVQILCFPWITVFWLDHPTRRLFLRFPRGYLACLLLCTIGLLALAVWTTLRQNPYVYEGAWLVFFWIVLLHLRISFWDDGDDRHHPDDDIPPDAPNDSGC
jgi:hypothetical protein